jgi:hypothetical protein
VQELSLEVGEVEGVGSKVAEEVGSRVVVRSVETWVAEASEAVWSSALAIIGLGLTRSVTAMANVAMTVAVLRMVDLNLIYVPV